MSKKNEGKEYKSISYMIKKSDPNWDSLCKYLHHANALRNQIIYEEMKPFFGKYPEIFQAYQEGTLEQLPYLNEQQRKVVLNKHINLLKKKAEVEKDGGVWIENITPNYRLRDINPITFSKEASKGKNTGAQIRGIYSAMSKSTFPSYEGKPENDHFHLMSSTLANSVINAYEKEEASFFGALKAYKKDPSKFKGYPRMPSFHDSYFCASSIGHGLRIKEGKAYVSQGLKNGKQQPPLVLSLPATNSHGSPSKRRVIEDASIKEIKFIPVYPYKKHTGEQSFERIKIAIAYSPTTSMEEKVDLDPTKYIGIDPGLTSLLTLASNDTTFAPQLIRGEKIKYINTYYNRERDRINSLLDKSHNKGVPEKGKSKKVSTTHALRRLSIRRDQTIGYEFDCLAKYIVELCLAYGIGNIVMGHNVGQKQEVSMGKKTNRRFVEIPYARFIQKLETKAKSAGIGFSAVDESYTSKASFLDGDVIPTYDKDKEGTYTFSGVREDKPKNLRERHYTTGRGAVVHSDINGAMNIIRKHAPSIFKNIDLYATYKEYMSLDNLALVSYKDIRDFLDN